MKDFFDFILPGVGFVEVRSIRKGEVKQHFTRDREDAAMLATTMDAKQWDVYFGVLPRMTEGGKSEDVASGATVLWADLDAKGETTKANALQSLIDYDISPSVIVDSGHGYHAYWKLAKSIPVKRACVIMRGLAKHLHGDSVYDAARILRVPGTINWKDDPVPVRVLRFDTTRVMRAGDFDYAEGVGERSVRKQEMPRAAARYVEPVDREPLPAWLTNVINIGEEVGMRSEACFKVMVHLIMRGYSDGEIVDVFERSVIGEKYREMSPRAGTRWMQRSLERARR